MKTQPTDITKDLVLPMLVMTPGDIKRLRRELIALNDYLQQQTLRSPGQSMGRMPRTSRLLDDTAAVNGLNLIDSAARLTLGTFLETAAGSVPVIRISFAVDPSSAFMLKIVAWFRQNINPLALLQVGLQPGIAAGCIVHTTNRYFDMSLRQTLQKHQDLLRDLLVKDDSMTEELPAVTVPATSEEAAV